MRRSPLLRLCAALCVALGAWLAFACAPASAAHIVHELEGRFSGSDVPGGPFQYVFGEAADNSGGLSDGAVYVAEIEARSEELASTVYKFDENGSYSGVKIDGADTPQGSIAFFSPETFALSFDGIAVDSSMGASASDLYVVNVAHGVVDRFNEAGQYLCQITGSATPSTSECNGPTGSETPDGGFVPTGLAVNEATGTLYVSDYQHKVIDEFNEAGSYIGQITDSHMTHPTGIELDSTGNLYVVNGAFFNGENVVKFDAAGSFVSVVDSNEPIGVAVDRATDHVYVAHSYENGGIVEYDSAGALLHSFGAGEERVYPSLDVNASTGRIYAGRFNFIESTVDMYSPDTYVPDVTANPATAIEETTASLSGNVDPAGYGEVISCRFEYGPTTAYENSVPCPPPTPYATSTAVSVNLSGLSPSTTYHFRLTAANPGVSPYTKGVPAHTSDGVVITTGPPTVDEESTSDIERTYATLHAKINPHGFDTEFKFEYVDDKHFEEEGGFASTATKSTSSSQLGDGLKPLAVNQVIAGLGVGTAYHYRAVATSSRGTAIGPTQTFTTHPVATIARQWAYAHVKSATVEAKISPSGLDTTCRVQYVDDAEFQLTGYDNAAVVPCTEDLGSGVEETIGKAELTGLAISTTYHFRFVVTNQSGTLSGDDEHFATFGIDSFTVEYVDEAGTPYTQAGGHPYEKIMHYGFNHTFVPGRNGSAGSLDAFIKDVITEQASGQTTGNVNNIPKCPGYKVDEEKCEKASEIGAVTIEYFSGGEITTRTTPLYNVVAPEGVANRIATVNPYTATDSHVRTGSDYGSTSIGSDISEEARVVGATVVIWGVPADHNGSGALRAPNIRNPTSCEGPLTARLSIDSWQLPGEYTTASAEMPATTGCDKLEFHPSIEWRPTTNVADSPTGLHVDVHQQQNEDPDGLAFADLRDAVVSPAKGLVLNPAGASGLVGCSPAQIGLHEETPPHCPDASKVGRAEIDTPLVDHPLLGGIYIATPHDNPFGSMFAIYVAVSDPRTGVAVKLAGDIQPNPHNGQITSHFSENPQLPVEDFKLDFYGGPRSVLQTPSECGTFVTNSTLTPWSAPESGPPAHPTDSYEIAAGPNHGACVGQEADAPNKPEFRAGTINPVAGAYSPFVIFLHREDGSQRIADLKVTPPRGLLGRLAGLPRCPDAAIAAAGQRSGSEELSNPSCPASSQVGTVTVAAGAGPNPYYVNGKAYLGGPYRGAPLSLAVIVPAVAGPFDLGTVVVHSPLQIELESGQIEVESDPIPTILEGVPLDVRTIAVKLDRPEFTLNPTNCDPTATIASVTSLEGQSVALSDPFRVGECRRLGFAPKIDLRLLGNTRRRGHPALRATLKMRSGGANIARIAVAMPPTEFLDINHIRGICTGEQFAAGTCPEDSVYGYARAWSPLLDQPLSGPVFMRSSAHRLPDLVMELNGEFRLALPTLIGTAHGGVQASAAGLPDAPVTKFVMTMQGRGRGLLQNSIDVCARPQRALIEIEAQNGKTAVLHPLLRANCPARSAARRRGG